MGTDVKPALPADRDSRKAIPLARGCLDYFPAALAYVARVSKAGNDVHNPGEPMHHARGKSSDHADCIARHLVDRGTVDPEDGLRHSGKIAWRALALLQEELEAAGEAPLARGAKLPTEAPATFTAGPRGSLGEEVADDWIEWEGGECPVDRHALVSIRMRDGTEFDRTRAGTWAWRNEGGRDDIVAYKVVSAPADGWVKWEGGDCPLPRAPLFSWQCALRLRDGTEMLVAYPRTWRWAHADSPTDIVAYKLVS